MPNRIIKESIHTSESVNEMTDFQFRLWVSLITYVDDYGRGDARPAIVRGSCFPLRDRITNKDIDAGLQALAAIGCVGLYEVDGKPYLWFPEWDSHQTVRNRRSKFPAPEEGNITICGKLQAVAINCNQLQSNVPVIQSNPIQSESLSESLSESERESESKSKSELPRSGGASTRPPVNYRRIVDAYNITCVSFPHVTTLSDARKKAIAARMKTYDYQAFEELFWKAEHSDFLKGKNDRNWSADFDWLIKDANMAKVLEGKYDNKGVPEDPDVYDPITYDAGSAERQKLLDRYINGENMTADEMRIIFGEDE